MIYLVFSSFQSGIDEGLYNPLRGHSHLDKMSPVAVEQLQTGT
jgi:hypothetical protein